MRRTEAHQGVRMIKFLDVLGRYEALEFNQLEAAEVTGADFRAGDQLGAGSMRAGNQGISGPGIFRRAPR
jgi:hypothetical protein